MRALRGAGAAYLPINRNFRLVIFISRSSETHKVENEAASRVCRPRSWLLKFIVVCTAVKLQCFPFQRRKASASSYQRAAASTALQDTGAAAAAGAKAKPIKIHTLRNLKNLFTSTSSVLKILRNPAVKSGAFLLLLYGKDIPSKALFHWGSKAAPAQATLLRCEYPRVISPERRARSPPARPHRAGWNRKTECRAGSEETGNFWKYLPSFWMTRASYEFTKVTHTNNSYDPTEMGPSESSHFTFEQ
ncbi:unnamed protein product [Chrysodeixis includens]|uniref:Uncharacterized protein n=1 Tax=Chrysodeixis includens TaxID=689277 RepID=A0A9N8PWT3_CHRIL|nr:unnamed protein product [Chrysodeixis includens]